MNNFKKSKEFDALFNNAAIGIIIVNGKCEIVLINNFALAQFGYKDNELTGKNIEELIPARYAKKHIEHRNDFLANPKGKMPMGAGRDLLGLRKDGNEFPVEISLSTYYINEFQYTITFINDITIRKSAEDELMKVNSHLENLIEARTKTLRETVNKLETQINEANEKDVQLRSALEKQKELNELKSRFVSLASHEFRTPLSTILSSAYLVLKYVTETEQSKREKHIDRIVSSVNTLTDILNDFLSVGKIEEGKIQTRTIDFNIFEMCNQMVAELNTILKKGQKIVYNHKGENIVFLDPSLLKHIILNLVTNAIKFSHDNSIITISTSCIGNVINVSVKDNGIGISKADQEHLFERFFRGTNVTNIQGTGLGLHIVARYVEIMNGSIKVLSELEQGTEFIITFLNKYNFNYENHTTN